MAGTDPAPSPETTLAVLLGATEWPEYPALKDQGRRTTTADQFAASAEGFLGYLLGPGGLGLPPANVKNLFDDPRSPSDLMVEVGRFLRERGRRVGVVRDVLVYFLGHGVPPEDNDYFLVLRYTKEGHKLATGLATSFLVEILVEQARHARCHLVLDVCFSGAAAGVFSSRPRPHQRVGMLCACGPSAPARAPDGHPHTMFTGALLDVLRDGSEAHGDRLSPGDVYALAKTRIAEVHGDAAVLPQIHNPGQRDGVVTDVPLFPNPGCRGADAGGAVPVWSGEPLPALPAGPLELIIRASESLGKVEESALAAVRLRSPTRTREMRDLVRVANRVGADKLLGGMKPDDLADFIAAWTQFEYTVRERYTELRDQVEVLRKKIARFCDQYAPPPKRKPRPKPRARKAGP